MIIPSNYEESILYPAALGNLIEGLCNAERLVLQLFWREAGLKPNIAKAILPGLRTHDAIEKLTRVYAAKKTNPSKNLERAFKQLADINTARNWIVHWGTRPDSDNALTVTNEFYALTPDALRTHPVSFRIVQSMCMDVKTINCALMVELGGHLKSVQKLPQWSDMLQDALAPWTYKFPQSGKSPDRNRESRGESKAQRKASQKLLAGRVKTRPA